MSSGIVVQDASLYNKLKITNSQPPPQQQQQQQQQQHQQQTSRYEVVDNFLTEVLSQQRKKHEVEKMKMNLKDKALLLDRSNLDRKNQKKQKKRKKNVSTALSRRAGLHVIPKNGQKYSNFVPMNLLWVQYMRSSFGSMGSPLSLHADERLLKIEYHGACVTVVNAKCSTLIGLRGIVVKETKQLFQMVTECDELNTVSKRGCIFMFEIDGFRVKINGDAIVGRAGTRNMKKKKGVFNSRLLLDSLTDG